MKIDLFKIAVLSVLAQSDPDWKLIVIDDAYPSLEPQAWVSQLEDSRITYVRNDSNVGINANFQRSLDLATQDRITIMGCDDVLLPHYVARVRALASEYDLDIIQPGTIVIDESGSECIPLADRVKRWIRPNHNGPLVLSGESLATSLSHGDWMYFPSLSWKVDRARKFGFHTDYRVVLDLALAFDLVNSGGALVLDDEPVFAYRRHRSSVSAWKAVDGSRFDEERMYLNDMADTFKRQGWRRAARAARLRWSSRLNSLASLPAAIATRQGAAVRSLTRHALSR